MVRLTGPFSRLGVCKVLVAGDLMLDTYTIGKALRISPEAPVAIIHVQHEENRPGGAGNVMLNLISLGAEVVAVGRVGNDVYGQALKELLSQEKIDVKGIVTQSSYFTPVKNRIIAENQQVVRVDHEKFMNLEEQLEQQIIDHLPVLFQEVQVVALSDYGKGFLTNTLLNAIIEYAKRLGIPVITDPKGRDFTKYIGTTMIKPNLTEAYSAANLSLATALETVAEKILHQVEAEVLLITRSEAGISIFERKGERQDFPVRVHEVKDVTGAGDTVLAMLAYAIGNKLALAEAAQLANVAAGIAIEHLGCARVTLKQLASRLLKYDGENKVFDEEHIFALQQALKGQKITIINVSGVEGLTSTIFQAIRKIAQQDHLKLLVYIRDEKPSEDFIHILASLQEVEFIILATSSLDNFCQLLKPQELHLIENVYVG
ncbi:Bifunctional protein HldE [Neochlamydia sp. TUME1]|nr:Bifunctional protein HldE [Neochlamydia sp. TUME1]